MRVRSAIDRWFRVLMGATAAIMMVSVALVPAGERPWAALGIAPIIGFLFWICRSTYYELRDDHLLCRSGPFGERISHASIRSLRLTQNLLSPMALSTQRIDIRQHGKGYILGTTIISPEDRECFLEELRRRCPSVE